jgi:hypothetical protein
MGIRAELGAIILVTAIPLVGIAGAACSSKNAEPGATAGAELDADLDDAGDLNPDTGTERCPVPQVVSASSCNPLDGGDAEAPDAAIGDDESDDEGDDGDPGYGDPLPTLEGPDDQCKYSLHLTTTPLVVNQPVTFTLDGALLAGTTPMTNATPRVEASLDDPSLDDTRVLALPDVKSDESAPGHYTIGPVTFDAPGVWTVRFFFFESCTEDAPDSPASRVAFALTVRAP